MNELKSILVGVDFSPGSACALRQAVRIAQWNRASLRVLHIVEAMVVVDMQEALGAAGVALNESIVRDAHEAWRRFAADAAGAADLPFEVDISTPTAGILSRSRQGDADLIVLGAHGWSGVGRGAGSTATGCVRRAPTRTLLVAEKQTGSFKTVVACVDFSATSHQVLEQAARVALQDDSGLCVIHVFDPPWRRLPYRATTPEGAPDYQRQYRHALARRLESFGDDIQPELAYLKPRFEVLDHRNHGDGIIEFARTVRADLVVLGTRGRTNLRDMMWGSTAERVLRDLPCSVLSLPAHD